MWLHPSYHLDAASPWPLYIGYLSLVGSTFSCRWLFSNYLWFWCSHRRRWVHVLLFHHLSIICTGKPKCSCDLLYYDTHFIAVVWSQIHNISKVCLYFTYCKRTHKHLRKSLILKLGLKRNRERHTETIYLRLGLEPNQTPAWDLNPCGWDSTRPKPMVPGFRT